jgi:hypothetical protein
MVLWKKSGYNKLNKEKRKTGKELRIRWCKLLRNKENKFIKKLKEKLIE